VIDRAKVWTGDLNETTLGTPVGGRLRLSAADTRAIEVILPAELRAELWPDDEFKSLVSDRG